jgi:hypothetical protein
MATLKDKILINTVNEIPNEKWQEAFEKHREKLNVDYRILSFGRIGKGYHYPTIRDAFMNSEFKNTTFKSISKYINLIDTTNNKTKLAAIAGAVEAWVDGMKNFPKIIIEPSFEPPDNYADLFIEEGKILLPFPKIVMISGGQNTSNNQVIPDGNINEFRFAVIEQDANDLKGILIHFLVRDIKYTDQQKLTVATLGVYVTENPQSHVLEIRPLIPQDQIGWLDVYEMQLIVREAMETIYMMTFHDGEVYASIPTPREIQVNQKKIRKGKTPLVEFKLISVLGKKRELPSVPHGSHASPRQHWRRGHWRSYRSGKRSWVAPMLVGDEENGKVVKDYAIGIYPEDANIHSSKLSV